MPSSKSPRFTVTPQPPNEALTYLKAKGWKVGFDYRDVWREEQLAPVLAPLRKAVDDATSYDDLVGRLKGVLGEMDTRKLAETLAKVLFLARAAGNTNL